MNGVAVKEVVDLGRTLTIAKKSLQVHERLTETKTFFKII